jgi:transposase-like protein
MMTKLSYSGYRFPPEIIQQAIWLYLRFTLSFRDVEDLLAERGNMVSWLLDFRGNQAVAVLLRQRKRDQ